MIHAHINENKELHPGAYRFDDRRVCGSGQTWPVVKCGAASSLKRAEPLVLTYVANAGVLVASGESKVLVDTLFDKPNPEYRPPRRTFSTKS